MIRLCRRCGYSHDDGQGQGPTDSEWQEMQAMYRDLEQRLEHSQLKEHDLSKRLFTREQLFHELESKLDMLLDIALSTSEAGRQSTVSKINKRRREPSPILKSIRKANRESGNRHTE